jgi:hypothetical protein
VSLNEIKLPEVEHAKFMKPGEINLLTIYWKKIRVLLVSVLKEQKPTEVINYNLVWGNSLKNELQVSKIHLAFNILAWEERMVDRFVRNQTKL